MYMLREELGLLIMMVRFGFLESKILTLMFLEELKLGIIHLLEMIQQFYMG